MSGRDPDKVVFFPHSLQFQKVPEPEQLEKIENVIPEKTFLEVQQDLPRGLDVHENLINFRADYPFVPIIPFASPAKLVLIGNTAQAINVPSGALFVRISYAGGNLAVSTKGNVSFPTVAGEESASEGILNPPNNTFYYVAGIRQLSAIGDTANVVASFEFYIQG